MVTTIRSTGQGDGLGRWARYALIGVLALGGAGGLAAAHAATRTVAPNGLVWADEFDGPAGSSVDRSKWDLMDLGGGWGNNELQAYTPRTQNASLDGQGNLRITALREDYTDPRGNRHGYTSARLESVPSFTFGRIEARIKVPAGQGLWAAFWTLGPDHRTVGWPTVGEIDIMEVLNQMRTVNANVHAAVISPQGQYRDRWTAAGNVKVSTPVSDDWHVYGLDWTEDKLVFTFDGEPYHTVLRSERTAGQDWPFNAPQELLLNLAVGGNWPGSPNQYTSFPATMLVDYVRVYDTSTIDPDC